MANYLQLHHHHQDHHHHRPWGGTRGGEEGGEGMLKDPLKFYRVRFHIKEDGEENGRNGDPTSLASRTPHNTHLTRVMHHRPRTCSTLATLTLNLNILCRRRGH